MGEEERPRVHKPTVGEFKGQPTLTLPVPDAGREDVRRNGKSLTDEP